jgi:glutamine synthetase
VDDAVFIYLHIGGWVKRHPPYEIQLFGDEFVEHFAASREWEEREYRRHVSDWELDRYFEII